MGTERHESRRIDNQLRGRSGRQGDPGESQFYLSLEDDLMRIFGGDRVKNMMDRLGMEDGEAIEHKWTSKAIESAQRRVEGHNFDIRKHLLKYDDVMNKQRQIIYALRKDVLGASDIKEGIKHDIGEVVEELVVGFSIPGKPPEEWDWKGIHENMLRVFDASAPVEASTLSPKNQHGLQDVLLAASVARYEEKEREFGPEFARRIEREVKLRTIDTFWKDHLLNMDQLKEGVGFEGYAQKDPLVVYKKKGFEMFSEMVFTIKEATLERLMHIRIEQEDVEEREELFRKPRPMQNYSMSRGQMPGAASPKGQVGAPGDPQRKTAVAGTIRRDGDKVGRNDPCPCGSGKKYKRCHGR